MRKIAHTVLQKGQIIKSKSGEKEWMVVETSADEVLLAAISSYKKLSNEDAMEWNLLENEDLHHL